jgi:hypothetical protein
MWLHLLLLAEIRSPRMRKRRAPRTSIMHGCCCRRLGTRDSGDAGGRLRGMGGDVQGPRWRGPAWEPLEWQRRELRTPTRWAAGEKRHGKWFDIRPEAAKHGVVRLWSSSSSACFWSPRIARRRAWTALVVVADMSPTYL